MNAKKKSDVHDLLNQLASQEEQFLAQEFLAPVLRGGKVQVRIGGVICQIQTEPRDFQGWGVFQPESHAEATFVREATLAERREYLKLFPQIRLIVCRRIGSIWFGSAASFGDQRVQMQGIGAISLISEVQMFDTVLTRYDGKQFWFDEVDRRANPTIAAYLRQSINDRVDPEDLSKSGLTAEQRAAYELNFWDLTGMEEDVQEGDSTSHGGALNDRRGWGTREDRDPIRRRLRESLSHAGANLIDYLEREDSCRVSFTVGDQSYTSSVNKEDLTVQVAGICLSGEDQKFDLSSLVGVLREGIDRNQIVREDD